VANCKNTVQMITIDQNKCNSCGLCVQTCHEYCIKIDDGALKIDYNFCSTCTQCIAICPKEALSWNNVKPVKYNKEFLPGSDELDELLKERRTIRDFKSEKINKDLLEEIVNYAIYSPTHSFDFRAIIIDNENLINQIDKTIFKFSLKIYQLLYKPKFFHIIVKLLTPKSEYEYLKVKPKLEAVLKRGRNFKTIPPAIVMIIADKRVPLGKESAQYALYSINLFAHTKGLGCRNLVGNQMFLNRSNSIRQKLGLKKHEKIVGTMAIGYPALKYRNKVNGKKVDIHWIN
jgi:nitroreductase/Pyruvate/2-oxoacid:ferredoxin oxidoreductase delta subunit